MAFELFEIPRAAIESRGRLAFVAVLPSNAIGDVSEKPFQAPTRLFEDHRELGPPHAPHTAIEEHGTGRFSHWDTTLVFSTSDGSSALHNGRTYRALLE